MDAEKTPAAQGFRMPAEWGPHDATWIAWPHNRDDWPGKFATVPWVYTEIVRSLASGERVHVLVRDRKMRRDAADRLDAAGADVSQTRFFKIATDRAWVRDSAPTFVVRDQVPTASASNGPSSEPPNKKLFADDRIGLVHWKFTAWAKYKNYRRDRRIGDQISERLCILNWWPRAMRKGRMRRVALEGGAIDVNGRGSLLATEECLLGDVQARNPGLDRAGLERVFADYLGVRHVIWLGRGIVGDDTHGHIDDIARFVSPSTVAAVVEPNVHDPNHEPLKENLQRLKAARDQDGQPLEVIELPMPRPVVFRGERLPASYANFYIANKRVLVPTFNDPADRIALGLLERAFPDREVVGIHCLDLVLGLGTLHCLTQQQPAPRLGGPLPSTTAGESPPPENPAPEGLIETGPRE